MELVALALDVSVVEIDVVVLEGIHDVIVSVLVLSVEVVEIEGIHHDDVTVSVLMVSDDGGLVEELLKVASVLDTVDNVSDAEVMLGDISVVGIENGGAVPVVLPVPVPQVDVDEVVPLP